MENGEDYIDFSKIKQSVNIEDPLLFGSYMKEVYKDLAERTADKKKGISKNTFMDYIKLPVFIAEKLFSSLDVDKDGYLNLKEFIDGMKQLYLGDYDETIESIFRLLDFDKDGFINKGDTKILLSYIPLKHEHKVEYKYQMASQDEIEQILSQTFTKKNTLNLKEFMEVTEQKKSDVFLQILCFIYQLKPFNESNLNMLRVCRKKSRTLVGTEPERISPAPKSKRLPSPNRKSYLQPAESFLQISLISGNEKKDSSPVNRKKSYGSSQFSEYSSMVRLPNGMIPKTQESEDLNTVLKNSKNIYNSPTAFFKRGAEKRVSEFNLNENLIKMEEFSLEDNKDNEDENKHILFEDWIVKLSESNKIKKYFLVVIGKDIYYYRNEKKDELLGMHNLSGCFVKENGEKKIGDEKFFSFMIQFTGKNRNYYCYEKSKAEQWISILRSSIGYLNFFEHYDMREDIGEGKFGLVKLGIHKKTKEKVAIKIIKKESMNASDVELVKSEIDIMKLCRHPNVVRLLDHFENAEYIFLIMEYLPGGDLSEYFRRNGFKISEARAAQIMFQLANGLKYLHQFGILHRDLKPDNIMLTECSDKGQIKIMDFGLSKIMGPGERAADGFGTLTFVAPEVLLRTPYNKQIDIWSLGVILYYMLSSTLPFDDENDSEEVIAKMIVFMDVQFPSKYWSKKSQHVIDLISRCLIKDPEKRITIEGFLNDEWIKKNLK